MGSEILTTAEGKRVEASNRGEEKWWVWGPYLSERQWATVREDYSANGSAWAYFPHDHARSRAYRWGEDGIAGISDHHQHLCFALTLWNGKDDILKERLFGLTGSGGTDPGNHGEDVKEYYFYLNNTPTHSYMKYLYKYPQAKFPYAQLVDTNRNRNSRESEYELIDTGVFANSRYFDVEVEYAKSGPEDICIRITARNRGPDSHTLHVLPTLWFRNTWSWGEQTELPSLRQIRLDDSGAIVEADHGVLKKRWLYCEKPLEVLFTNNETNFERLFPPTKNPGPYVKDAFHRRLILGDETAVNPAKEGTKAAAWYKLELRSGASATVRLRLSNEGYRTDAFGSAFDQLFSQRIAEADEFYDTVCPFKASQDKDRDADLRSIQRQALAGMLWSKQFYHYVVDTWWKGDPPNEKPEGRLPADGRNAQWRHLYCRDILSMPDKWEYDWFAAWDLAFHTIPLAMIDPGFAKRQLYLLLREWLMHPNGQVPAYEWSFNDVNPPVQAWAAYRVYKIEQKMYGRQDVDFLERMFQKLLLYFTWWVNRKDAEGRNIFQGGFLGLDNISLIDRTNLGIAGGQLDQADATGWMAMFCLNMLRIAVELGKMDPIYRDWAGKFLQHFLLITQAMRLIGGNQNLWDPNDGFFYDILKIGGNPTTLKVRSVVGLVPLFAVEEIDLAQARQTDDSGFASSAGFSDLREQFDWFMRNSPPMPGDPYVSVSKAQTGRVLLSIVDEANLRRILRYMLDENEFLSPYGIRSLSKCHQNPYRLSINGQDCTIEYEPAESRTTMFGGNSNWRGPIWMPINFLIIESLQKFDHFLGNGFKVECPVGSGNMMTLWDVSMELTQRLISIFQRDKNGKRPVYGGTTMFQDDPYWRDLILFYEYFHGDNGAGIGASHQTGWTGLVAKLIRQRAEY